MTRAEIWLSYVVSNPPEIDPILYSVVMESLQKLGETRTSILITSFAAEQMRLLRQEVQKIM